MKDNKKKNKALFEHDDEVEEAACHLLEAVADEARLQLSKVHDPFEQYAHKVRSKSHSDINVLREHFVKGYEVLLEELSHE